MIKRFPTFRNLPTWLSRFQTQPTPILPLVRPPLNELAEHPESLPPLIQQCSVALRYVKFLGPLNWGNFPQRSSQRPWPGPTPQPRAPFAAAYLIKLNEKHRSMGDLRRYLIEHPALVWVIGFPLTPSTNEPWGFDVTASVPSVDMLLQVLKTISQAELHYLLGQTVSIIWQTLPPTYPFGHFTSLDTKHIIAWVKENNPKVYIKEGRYDKKKQPKGDKDCTLGVKRRSNQTTSKPKSPQKTPTSQAKPAQQVSVSEVYWGYGSGVVVTKVPQLAEVVLAELTLPFHENDINYFFPLMKQVEQRLGFRPPFGAYDAAFDAWYVYQYHFEAGGIALVPFVKKGQTNRLFDDQQRPLCSAGFGMYPKVRFTSRTDPQPQLKLRYACPLIFPDRTGKTCPINHKNWAKGGCTSTMGASKGAFIRYALDRNSPFFKHLYKQRTATERINSQAKALGIERPILRNRKAISNQNTLIYILINLKTFHRLKRSID